VGGGGDRPDFQALKRDRKIKPQSRGREAMTVTVVGRGREGVLGCRGGFSAVKLQKCYVLKWTSAENNGGQADRMSKEGGSKREKSVFTLD